MVLPDDLYMDLVAELSLRLDTAEVAIIGDFPAVYTARWAPPLKEFVPLGHEITRGFYGWPLRLTNDGGEYLSNGYYDLGILDDHFDPSEVRPVGPDLNNVRCAPAGIRRRIRKAIEKAEGRESETDDDSGDDDSGDDDSGDDDDEEDPDGHILDLMEAFAAHGFNIMLH